MILVVCRNVGPSGQLPGNQILKIYPEGYEEFARHSFACREAISPATADVNIFICLYLGQDPKSNLGT